MKPQTTQKDPSRWSYWINLAIAVLSALVGAIGAKAATVTHLVG